MQRPPKHVANDAAERFQHVEVDAVQQPVESFGLVVIDGFVG